MKINENEEKLRASNISKHSAVFVLGAGFSNAIGSCAVNNKSFDSPLDKNFFKVLKEQGILNNLLSDKPCLTSILNWMNIYDRDTDELKQEDFSLEQFWTRIDLILKLNSSISGFPDFGLLMPPDAPIQNGIPNLDSYKDLMSQEERALYEYLSDTKKGNFFNPEGLLLYSADYELKRLIFDVYSTIKPRDDCRVDKFKQIVDEAPIISFNYDCLIDSIFQEHGIFDYNNRTNFRNNKLIIKPHGSLGWKVKKRYSVDSVGNGGVVEIQGRDIGRKVPSDMFSNTKVNGSLEMSFPIILPMCPSKENIVAGLDSKRIKICPDNEDNKKREFIDCVVVYAKMVEVIRSAKLLIFIGYSFPQMDYETVALLNLATKHSDDRECHICVKGRDIPYCGILCKKIVYYQNGLEQFLREYKDPRYTQ